MRLTHSSNPQETPKADPAPKGRGLDTSLPDGTEMRVSLPLPPEFKAIANPGVAQAFAQGDTRVKIYETPSRVLGLRGPKAEILNLSAEPIGKLHSWLPHGLQAEKVVFLPDACPGKSPLPTGSAVLTFQPDWRRFAVRRCPKITWSNFSRSLSLRYEPRCDRLEVQSPEAGHG